MPYTGIKTVTFERILVLYGAIQIENLIFIKNYDIILKKDKISERFIDFLIKLWYYSKKNH